MSLQLVPEGNIRFHGPFTETVKKALTVTNTNPTLVAFKVKTTAPKIIHVRPNSGRIEPGESMEVMILATAGGGLPNYPVKVLFLSAFITSEDPEDQVPLDAYPSDQYEIHPRKLTVSFLPPLEEEEPTATDPDANGEATPESLSPASTPVLPPPPLPLNISKRHESVDDVRQPPDADMASPPPPPPIPALAPLDKQSLEQQLVDAREEIRHLRALLARSGTSACDRAADTQTRTPVLKGLVFGLESMLATLRNLHGPPLASSELHSGG